MYNRRVWIRGVLAASVGGFTAHQLWRHGHDYVLVSQFAEIEPGKIYRGAWQKPWPMRRIVRDYHIKTVLALAHPPEHALAIREKALSEELGIRWIHIPIVDRRNEGNSKSVSDLLEDAAAIVADPANQPVYLHCHHGLNRASMVQIAYRTKYCGWTLQRAFDEIQNTFGLVTVAHGPDYHHMEEFYETRVLPLRQAGNPTLKVGPETGFAEVILAPAKLSAASPDPAAAMRR